MRSFKLYIPRLLAIVASSAALFVRRFSGVGPRPDQSAQELYEYTVFER